MKIEAIKNINITVLFSAPINHLLVSQKDLLDMFKSGDQQKDLHTFIEAPGLKVISFPNFKKDIVFESVRLLVNDKSENIKELQVVDDLQKIVSSGMVEKDKIVAFGFNYEAVTVPQNNNFKINELVGAKISEIEGIKSAGVNVLYEKNNITYVLEIKPIQMEGDEKKFITLFNVHFSASKLPTAEELKKSILEQFNEFKKVIEKI